MATITFFRETFGGVETRRPISTLAFELDRIRVADLIRLRVEMAYDQECAPEAAPDAGSSAWLKRLGARKSGPSLDEAIAEAQRGLAANAFFLILNGKQMRDLDEEVALDDANSAVFLELRQLKGG